MGQSFTVNMCLLHSFAKRSCKQYLHQSSMQQHVWRFLKALATSWKRRPYLSCKFSPTSHSWEVRACSTGIQNLESYNNLIAALHPTSLTLPPDTVPQNTRLLRNFWSTLRQLSPTLLCNCILHPFFNLPITLPQHFLSVFPLTFFYSTSENFPIDVMSQPRIGIASQRC